MNFKSILAQVREINGPNQETDKSTTSRTGSRSSKTFQIPFKSGDILLLDAYIPHYAGDNHSDRPRRALFFSFNRLDDGNFNKGNILITVVAPALLQKNYFPIQHFISENVSNQLALR